LALGYSGLSLKGALAVLRNTFRWLLCFPIAMPLYIGAQTSPATPEPTIRASADLVVVDVVVTDGQQNPVHNLSGANFTILEDGKPQTVKVFEEHTAQAAAPLPPKPQMAPGSFTNYTPAPASGALDILLLDKLNTPLNAQVYARQQVLSYLKNAPPGRRMAIFTLTTELHLLQGFTSDPEQLRAIVEGKKGTPGGSPLMTNQMSGDNAGDETWVDSLSDMVGNDPSTQQMLANLQQFQAEQQSFQLQLRARYTLDALNQLARYLSNLPGRKNLIWFSGSFPVNILPDGDLQNPFAVVASSEDEFRETSDLMARSQVAVYPVDARGLMTSPMMDASRSGQGYAKNPGKFASDQSKFFAQTSEEHGTMLQMAEATGGKAFINTNGLKEAVEKAVDLGSNYYTIAYAPANRNWNGNYRKIQVKLDKPGVALAYRRGYFADNPSAPVRHSELQSGKVALPPYNALHAAMLHGGPDPTEIVFEANVRPSTAETEPEVAAGNVSAKKMTGPFRRYTIEFRVSPKELACDVAADGARTCSLEFITFVYDPDGVQLNVQANGIRAQFTPAQYQALLSGHLRYRQQISVPAKGDYFLRLGLHDTTSGRIGALELPVAAVARLQPAAALAPGTTPSR
jgi:VWFA-related protein